MLELKAVTCMRGYQPLFEPLTLALQAGHCLHVRGLNGAGKTTLLRTLAGLMPPHQGTIEWKGVSIKEQKKTYAQQLLYIGHHEGLKQDLTPVENLRWSLEQDGQPWHRDQAQAALAQVGLKGREHRALRWFSAGQKRRVLMSQLLLKPRALWILDEPFNALDQQGVQWLLQQLKGHIQQGGMAVLTSHQEIELDGAKEIAL